MKVRGSKAVPRGAEAGVLAVCGGTSSGSWLREAVGGLEKRGNADDKPKSIFVTAYPKLSLSELLCAEIFCSI